MSTKKKLFQAAAGSAGGAGLDVDEVFSTFIHEGDDSASKNIVNGIDLQNEGGLVFSKSIDAAIDWGACDTVGVGTGKELKPNTNGGAASDTDLISSFNSNGFTVGGDPQWNQSARGTYCTWTWRKAERFFDIQTWTGDGTANRSISHNLGCDIGFILIKRLDTSGSWLARHRSMSDNDNMELTTNGASFSNTQYINSLSSTSFTISQNGDVNGSGGSYVAYIWAHNDGDGTFGPDGDQDIIKCGTWTGNGTQPSGISINLGFEPQFIMWKRADALGDWYWVDNLRGFDKTNDANKFLKVNATDIQSTGNDYIFPSPTGFDIEENLTVANANGGEYVYMAIRRGPLAEPESATDVFKAVTRDSSTGGVNYYTGFPVDMSILNVRTSPGNYVHARLTANKRLQTSNNNAEISGDAVDFQTNVGYQPGSSSTNTNALTWNWRRAPGFFDVVAYTGDGTGVRTINHNLGVAPEMIWIKGRNATMSWIVYHASLGNDYVMRLEQTSAATSGSSLYWNNTDPTSSVWTINSNLNTSGRQYICYLFATLAGISKVGSFSHTFGSDTNVDCGFSSGARFVLVKNYNASGNWTVWDTARGIVAGNDPRLFINSTAAENTATDAIDPYSPGFTITGNWLATGDYIFYAIA